MNTKLLINLTITVVVFIGSVAASINSYSENKALENELNSKLQSKQDELKNKQHELVTIAQDGENKAKLIALLNTKFTQYQQEWNANQVGFVDSTLITPSATWRSATDETKTNIENYLTSLNEAEATDYVEAIENDKTHKSYNNIEQIKARKVRDQEGFQNQDMAAILFLEYAMLSNWI
jgi:low affinity Fe/Cu permease/DNA-binding transcriptional regulator YiaG